jgi:hypothetical protein
MKLTVKSQSAFKQQLLDAGVAPSQLKAAMAHVKDKGALKAGQTVTIPDRFTKDDAAATRKTLGDTGDRGRASSEKTGRTLGHLGIHAFSDVDVPRSARTGRLVDACGSSELMFGGGFPGTDACGGGGGAVRGGGSRRTVASSDGCGGSVSTRGRTVASSDGCGGSVSTRGRTVSSSDGCGGSVSTRGRTVSTADGCGGSVTPRRRGVSTGGGC